MRLLKAKRLEACRKALTSAALVHRRLSEIAFSSGFSDMTHFSHLFKAAYGLLAHDHRKNAGNVGGRAAAVG
jgi:AraC family transcriptional activator of tynA and feaB